MINSLPVRRSHIVAMKYLSVFIFFYSRHPGLYVIYRFIKNAAINIRNLHAYLGRIFIWIYFSMSYDGHLFSGILQGRLHEIENP